MYKHRLLHITVWALASSTAMAEEPALRIGISDSDSPPIVIIGREPDKGIIRGLSRDLGDALARTINRQPDYIILSRNRVENAITTGKVDIICNTNPKWLSNSEQFGWTRQFYPLIERVFSLNGVPDITRLEQLESKRIGTILGYHYATLEPMWQARRSIRVDESRIDMLMRAVQVKLVDVAIESEMEFAAWAMANHHEARALKMHPMVFTSSPTMCAVSPKSAVTTKELNLGIDKLEKTGQLKEILKRYQWHDSE